jgi:VanZ family protein
MIAVGKWPRQHLMRLAPAVGWMLVIFVLSSRSQYPQPRERLAELSAIAVHLFAYGVLALLLFRVLAPMSRPRWTTATVAVLLATAYGISDEVHQSFVAGRSATAFDVGVDFVGAVVGAWLGHRRLAARRPEPVP